MKTQLRRIALVLLLALGVELLSPPTRVLSQGPAPAESLPLQGSGVRVAAVLMRLERDLQDLVDTADKPGGLLGWREAITPHQLALLQLVPGARRELDGFADYLARQGFAPEIRQRHQQAATAIAGRLQELLSDLTDAVHQTEPEEATPHIGQVLARIRSWGGHDLVAPLPDTLPFGPSRTPAPIAVVPEPAATSGVATVPVATGFPTMEDWGQGSLPDEEHAFNTIIDEAGDSIADLTRWVYEHIQTEWYDGHVKPPLAVARQWRANDLDAAVFSVALLRAAGHPARYAGGVIALGPDEWESYVGLADGDAAARFLAATGRAVTQVKDAAGVARELRVFHWWTEVYDLEAARWLAVDPAWKPRQSKGHAAGSHGDLSRFDLARYLYGRQTESPLEAFADTAGDDRAPAPQDAGDAQPLPVGEMPALPFRVIGQAQSADALPAGTAATVQIALGGLSIELPLAEVDGLPLTLQYAAATAADQQLLDTWKESFFPGYLVQLHPVLEVGKRTVSIGDPVAAGDPQLLTLTIRMGQLRETVQHVVAAGNLYSITLGPVEISDPAGAPGTPQSDLVGSTLRALAQDYFRRVNADAGRLGRLTGTHLAPGAQTAVNAFELDHAWLAGYPYFSWAAGVRMDAARLAITPVHPHNSEEQERLFSVLLGAQAAWRESRVFTEAFGLPPQRSTLPLLTSAIDEGSPLYWVCRLNGDTELPETGFGAPTQARLEAAFSREWLLAMPPGPVSGEEPYIVIDPLTGASGYYLGDGSNGDGLGFADILQGKSEVGLRSGQWLLASAGTFHLNFTLPGVDIFPPVIPPIPQPSEPGYGIVQMKPPILPHVSCLEAVQVFPPAVQQQLKDKACEQARLFLQGFAFGLKDGMVFGVEAALDVWGHLDKALATWQDFYDHPGEVIAELSAQVASVWAQRQEIVNGLLQVYADHIQQRSGLRAGDSRLLIWGFGYAGGFVAGLFYTSLIPQPGDLIFGSLVAVVIIGGKVLYKLAVTRLVGPLFQGVRHLTTREAGQGLLALARTLIRDETGSVNLDVLLRRLPDVPLRDREFILGHLRQLSQKAGYDVARFVSLSPEVQDTLLRATNRLLTEMTNFEADSIWRWMKKGWTGANDLEYAKKLWSTRYRIQHAIEASMATPLTYGEGLGDEIARRVLANFRKLPNPAYHLTIEEFRLLSILPFQDLTDRQLELVIAVRRAMPRGKTLVRYIAVGSPTVRHTLLWMMANPEDAKIKGFVTFLEHMAGIESSEDIKRVLALFSPDKHGLKQSELIAEIRIPLSKLEGKSGFELNIPWHESLWNEMEPGQGGYMLDYAWLGTGFTANPGPRVVPEWHLPNLMDIVEGTEIIIRDARGWVATLQFDGKQFHTVAGRLPWR